MYDFKIQVPNVSKAELHKRLKKIIDKYNSEIKKNNVSIMQANDVYDIYAEKNLMFVNYYVKASVEVFDDYLQVKYDTNAPDWAAKNAINNFINEIKQK